MSTKLLYSNVEYIPDNLRQQATKTERGYELDAKPLLEKHKELQAELHRNRETNDSLKALASSNPTAAQFVLREQELRQRLEREKNDAVQATKVEYQQVLEHDRNAWNREKQSLIDLITDERINNAVLHENGEPLFVAPYVKEFIRAELQQDGKLSTELVDKNDEPMRDSKGMPVTLQSFIKALQTDSTFKKAFNSNPPAVGDSAASDGVERYTNNQRRIILTREQAKDVQIYREAVKRAGSVDNVIVEQQ